MSDQQIEVGSVVKLNSAEEGPRMTVVRDSTDGNVTNPGWIRCHWFVDGHLHMGDFPTMALYLEKQL